jgi:hypothetical protein
MHTKDKRLAYKRAVVKVLKDNFRLLKAIQKNPSDTLLFQIDDLIYSNYRLNHCVSDTFPIIKQVIQEWK